MSHTQPERGDTSETISVTTSARGDDELSQDDPANWGSEEEDYGEASDGDGQAETLEKILSYKDPHGDFLHRYVDGQGAAHDLLLVWDSCLHGAAFAHSHLGSHTLIEFACYVCVLGYLCAGTPMQGMDAPEKRHVLTSTWFRDSIPLGTYKWLVKSCSQKGPRLNDSTISTYFDPSTQAWAMLIQTFLRQDECSLQEVRCGQIVLCPSLCRFFYASVPVPVPMYICVFSLFVSLCLCGRVFSLFVSFSL